MSSDTVDMSSETVDLEVQSSDLLVSIFLIFSNKSSLQRCIFIKNQNILKIILLDILYNFELFNRNSLCHTIRIIEGITQVPYLIKVSSFGKRTEVRTSPHLNGRARTKKSKNKTKQQPQKSTKTYKIYKNEIRNMSGGNVHYH